MNTFARAGAAALLCLACATSNAMAKDLIAPPPTHYRTVQVDGIKIAYREAGDPRLPTIIMFHGFPGSSFQYRDILPLLADRYHVIAPDMPGFGWSDQPSRETYKYTFDHITETMDHFTQVMGLKKYTLLVCDYGGPVGYRLALLHPERVQAIISQNGNAYEEGVKSADWDPIKAAWKNPSAENRKVLKSVTDFEFTKYEFLGGVPDPTRIPPETYTLADDAMKKPGNEDIQIDLIADFATELDRYPKYQKYFREHQPPLIAVWGKNDPFFLYPAAEAFKRDLPKAEVHFYNTGHFAMETDAYPIANDIRKFMASHVPSK